MLDTGILEEGEKAELIDGLITHEGMIDRMTQNSHHTMSSILVEDELRLICPTTMRVRAGKPLSLINGSEPEPDVFIVSGSARDYPGGHPTTALLVVEVSDASLRYDRTKKASLYASAGIPEYWIVNLQDRSVEVHREPVEDLDHPFGARYNDIHRAKEGDSIQPLFAPEHSIPVNNMLP
jgi:Uma2 family endonuclease